MSSKPYPFPWEQWRAALDHFEKAMLNPAKRAQGAVAVSQAYFSRAYSIPEESTWKRLRFEKAMRWLDAHLDEVEPRNFDVVGTDLSLVGYKTQRAVHYLFSGIADELLNDDPPVDAMLVLVRQMEEAGI